MLKLHSRAVEALSEVWPSTKGIHRLADRGTDVAALRHSEYFLVQNKEDQAPEGYRGYLYFEKPDGRLPNNSFLLEKDLFYLRGGDVVKLDPNRKYLRTLYRRNSQQNHFLVTERCNSFCLMCSQPPRDIDDSYIADDILEAIPLIGRETRSIGITGGEPTLLGDKLFEIIRSLKSYLPSAAVHILSNGRRFKESSLAHAIAAIDHHDLMIGIPIYSDVPSLHDYVVQADGAFDDTIRGILNLKGSGIKVEIRVVLHKLTYERLPGLARFIRRNLIFCDHIALMGLEITGFTRSNLEKLWIDPKDYQPQLREAVEILNQGKLTVSIYNHQLCVLDEWLRPFSRKSISDWKNEFMPECSGCARKRECGGFFSSAKLRYSSHIVAFED
jgi:His-Xaa-Ser system radical SAM maturase HxsC